MNYTEVKRYLVYKDKLDIDEFDVNNSHNLDYRMLEAMENDQFFITCDGAPGYTVQIFNMAYYITTMVMLEKHPLQYVGTYLCIADKVCGKYGDCNAWHNLFCAMTMTLVTNNLRVLQPENLNLKKWYDAIIYRFQSLPPRETGVPQAQSFIINNILKEMGAHSLAVYPDHFKPRPIIEALQDSNYRDIAENMAFIKLRIGLLSDEEQQLAKKTIQRVTNDSGEKALEGAMPEAAADVRRLMAKVAQEFGFEVSPTEKNEETEEITIAAQSAEIERLKEERDKAIREKEELEEDLKAYMERNQNRRGINRLKTAHLGLKLAPKLGITFTNKKELAPVLSKLFGWGQNSLEKQMSKYLSEEEELELAEIFGGVSPELAKFICYKWEAKPK